MIATLLTQLARAVDARTAFVDESKATNHTNAFRLFNGFLEGCPALVIDLYAKTIVMHNYANPAHEGTPLVGAAQTWLLEKFSWIEAVILKTRHGETEEARRGQFIVGTDCDRWVREHGVRYAIDPLMNRDASLYLDTRTLRHWAIDNLGGKTVLNTFAYTGSLGVAAHAGGAERVVQTDLNRNFLNVAKTSYTLNGFPVHKRDFQKGDYWSHMNRLKRYGEQFDCIFIDPPFFSATKKGRLNLSHDTVRLVNKVRPLVKHDGRIVAINNALFFSGQAYMDALSSLCEDGYVSIEELVPIAEDFTGYPQTRVNNFVTDPAPFNHSTKIVVLRVQHKTTDSLSNL
ncbi:MAG: class I SAM-dependent methyltransferase [Chloroflexota bacterium]